MEKNPLVDRLQSLYEHIAIPLVVFQKDDLAILYCNSYLEKLLGREMFEICMDSSSELFGKEPRDRFKGFLEAAKKGLQELKGVRFKIPKGGEKIANLKLVSAHTAFGDILVMSVHETSNETDEAHLRAAKMAALGEMTGGIAHEINNPLTIADGYARQLVDRIDKGETDVKKFREMAEKIYLTTERVARVTRTLRVFSRDERDEPFETVSLNEVIQDAASFCQERFKSKQIELRLKPFSTEIEIRCRSHQLSQVILNILNNAVDAIETFDEKWVEIGVEESAERVRILIKDSGKGIPENVRRKVFDPFFTTKDEDRGTGIGLSLSASIVSDHSGELGIDPDCENTCFTLELPRVKPNDKSGASSMRGGRQAA